MYAGTLISWLLVSGIDGLETRSLPVGEQALLGSWSPAPNVEPPTIGVGFDLTASYGFNDPLTESRDVH